MNPDVLSVIDREALHRAAQSFAATGQFAGWREVLREMLRHGHFGSATLFLDRKVAEEIETISHEARRRAAAQIVQLSDGEPERRD
jgi:hypothetical protein